MMKVSHILNIIFIILLLLGICIAEELVVSSSLQDIQKRCYSIEQLVRDDESLKRMEVVLAVDNLEDRWTNDESNLCYMVNHKNIQEIGQEIAKMKGYISSNDIDAFRVSIETIKLYCHGYMHFMGANIHNVL